MTMNYIVRVIPIMINMKAFSQIKISSIRKWGKIEELLSRLTLKANKRKKTHSKYVWKSLKIVNKN